MSRIAVHLEREPEHSPYTYSHPLDDGSGFENSGFNGFGGAGGFGNIRSIDPFNQKLRDHGPSIYDAQHRLVISYV